MLWHGGTIGGEANACGVVVNNGRGGSGRCGAVVRTVAARCSGGLRRLALLVIVGSGGGGVFLGPHLTEVTLWSPPMVG